MKKILVLIIYLGTFSIATRAQDIQGLVSHWSFDGDSESRVVDNVGECHGVPTKVGYTDGVIGKAATFNGKASRIIVSDSNGLPPTAVTSLEYGTLSVWIRFENRGGQVLPILYLGKESSSMPNRSMIFEVGHDRGSVDNRRLYFTTIYSPQQNFCVDSNINLSEGVWYHYVAVMSESGSTIYLNGIEITRRRYNLGSTKSCSVFFNDVPNKELLSIGYGKYSQEEPFFSFNGAIDDLRIYNRALNQTEVLALFNMSGLKMGDNGLGYIDAESMVGQEPMESPMQSGKRGMKQPQERANSRTSTNRGYSNYDRTNYNRTNYNR